MWIQLKPAVKFGLRERETEKECRFGSQRQYQKGLYCQDTEQTLFAENNWEVERARGCADTAAGMLQRSELQPNGKKKHWKSWSKEIFCTMLFIRAKAKATKNKIHVCPPGATGANRKVGGKNKSTTRTPAAWHKQTHVYWSHGLLRNVSSCKWYIQKNVYLLSDASKEKWTYMDDVRLPGHKDSSKRGCGADKMETMECFEKSCPGDVRRPGNGMSGILLDQQQRYS